jgi:tetratricopeptide (TPR) repeat protein
MGALVVLVAVLLVYVQALGGGFVWDDRFLILGAPLVERGAALDEYLRAPFWTGGGGVEQSGYYRPLVTLSFALDHRLHAGNAAGFHLTNLVLHALNALLLHALLRKHDVRPLVAAWLALVWALLPRLAEAAAWISGRTDLLAATGALAALLAFEPSLRRSALAALFLGLGLFSKESALAVLPAIALAIWVGRRNGQAAPPARRLLLAAAPLFCVVVLYLVLRLRAIGYQSASLELGAIGRIATFFDALGTYGFMLVDVLRPRAVIGRVGVINPLMVALGAALLMTIAWLLWRYRAHIHATQAMGLGLALGAFLPVLHIVPFPVRTLTADRYLYLPVAGLVLAAAPAIDRWLGMRRRALFAAFALVAVLGVSTSRRVGVWSDELEFWAQTYLETPRTNNVAATELGSVYFRAGLFDDALSLFRLALEYDDPERSSPRYNAAICLSRVGQREAAKKLLERVRPTRRADRDIEFHLATIEMREPNAGQAQARLQRAAAAGHAGARFLLPRFESLRAARDELERKGAGARPEESARLLTLLGEEGPGNVAWARAAAAPDASRAVSFDALTHLARTGPRDVLLATYRRHVARFGPIPPALEESIAVRVAELDRLMAARTRLSLPVPASERTPLP